MLIIACGAVGLLAVGYFVGQFVPCPVIDSTAPAMEPGDWYQFWAKMIAAIGTYLAILVALFKDDYSRWRNAPKLVVHHPKDGKAEEIRGSQTQKSQGAPIEGFVYKFGIENRGRNPARDCKMVIERLWKNTDLGRQQTLKVEAPELCWADKGPPSIAIPPTAIIPVAVIRLSAPMAAGGASGTAGGGGAPPLEPPCLSIGSYTLVGEAGTWGAVLAIYGDDFTPVRKRIKVQWNGEYRASRDQLHEQCLFITVENEKGA